MDGFKSCFYWYHFVSCTLGWVRLEGVASGQCMLSLGWMNVAFSIYVFKQKPDTLLIHTFCFMPRLKKGIKAFLL